MVLRWNITIDNLSRLVRNSQTIDDIKCRTFVENPVLPDFRRSHNNDKRINILALIFDDEFRVIITYKGLGISPDNQLKTGLRIINVEDQISSLEHDVHV